MATVQVAVSACPDNGPTIMIELNAMFKVQPRPLTHSDAFWVLATLWFLILSVFHAYPSLDVAISGIFFRETACESSLASSYCGYFPLSKEGAFKALRWSLYALPYIGAGLVVIAIAIGTFIRAWRDVIPLRRLWLSLASLGVSTGLITNVWLKGHSGRPRPYQTDLFGGQWDFMPAGSFLGSCHRNCSFISGEASGAGWLICLLIFVPPTYRKWVAPPVIIASVATAFLRVTMGAHYASDVMLGWLVSIVVFVGLLALEQSFDRLAAARHGNANVGGSG